MTQIKQNKNREQKLDRAMKAGKNSDRQTECVFGRLREGKSLPRGLKLDVEQIRRSQSEYGFQIVSATGKQGTLEEILSIERPARKKLLGQISTPNWIADYMAALCIKRPDERGIDPCFGDGVFITTMAKRLMELKGGRDDISSQITGIELDPELFVKGISEYERILQETVNLENLYLGNFFDFRENQGCFDFGMMNPPYVRQEELSSTNLPRSMRKETLLKTFGKLFPIDYISKRANLYFYFFLYLSNFIREGGRLIAITYNSWLYSKYGELLQRFFLDNFKIEYIIDFDREAFEESIIGSCIILLEKATGRKNEEIRDENVVRFIRLKAKAPLTRLLEATESERRGSGLVRRDIIPQENLYSDNKWEKYFTLPEFHERLLSNWKLTPLRNLANVFRGFEPKSSRFFILDDTRVADFKIEDDYVIPVLKNPKTLRSLRVSDRSNRSLLLYITKRKTDLRRDAKSIGVLEYLSYIEGEILGNKDKFKALSTLIEKDNDGWYLQKLKNSGEIIFSYIIRENKWFYLNDCGVITTDNFHNLVPRADKYALFAMLNSSLTRYLLETSGRTQGSGLLKVQVYELQDLLVPNLAIAPTKTIEELSELGKMLSECVGRSENAGTSGKIMAKIDAVIFGFIENDGLLRPLTGAEAKMRNDRLQRKNRG